MEGYFRSNERPSQRPTTLINLPQKAIENLSQYRYLLEIDAKKTAEEIVEFLINTANIMGKDNLLVPLSGGLDSAVVAALAKQTGLSTDAITIFDDIYTRPQDMEDAADICKRLGLHQYIYDNSQFVHEIFYSGKEAINLMMGFREARINVEAAKLGSLLPSCGNRSEIFGLSSLNSIVGEAYPLVMLYKTQIYELAKVLNLPEHIKIKQSHSGILNDPDDEEFLGLEFKTYDTLLAMINKFSVEEISEKLDCDLSDIIKKLKRCSARLSFPVYIPR